MYTIGDFLIRIKNGYMAHKRSVDVPYSKVAESIAKILVRESYVKGFEVIQEGNRSVLRINLAYKNGLPALKDVRIISKPSVQVYTNKNKLKVLGRDLGMHIVSTSKGMMTQKQAQKEGLGGELLCQII